ncbi:ABC transporter permease, partial [Streptomyces sp. JV178]
QDIGQNAGSIVEMLFLAAAWYLILTSIFSVGQYYLERYYAKGSTRSLPPTPIQRFKAMLPARRPKGVSA